MFGGILIPEPSPCLSLPQVANGKENKKGPSVPFYETQLRKMLMRFDTNRDGRLSKQELYAAFKSLGSHWAEFRAIRALHLADRNGDGCINADEFDALVKYVIKIGYTVN